MQYLPLILLFALAITVSTIVVKLIAKTFFNHRQNRDSQLLNHPDIQSALNNGRIIEAIQLLHKNHNMGLRDAKHLIDECAPRPSPTPRSSKKIDAVELPVVASDVTPAIETTEIPKVNGEVWINNSNAHVTLRPSIGSQGFSLRNEGTWGGPHTEIFLKSEELASKLATSNSAELTIALDGPGSVGSISDLSGYAAADAGPHIRWITAATLRIVREFGLIRFEFHGETGFLDPQFVYDTREDLKSAGCYSFRVWFEICDADIDLYITDEVASGAMASYVKRVKPI